MTEHQHAMWARVALKIAGLLFCTFLVTQGWVFWPCFMALGLLGAFDGL